MAKMEKTQMEVTLSSETKRYLRNLTSALEKVARGMAVYRPQTDKWHDRDDNPMDVDTPKRLSEPAEDPTLPDLQDQYAEVRDEETRRARKRIFGGV